ncbi:hypothetical protein K501DRAFT_269229 [Backusella circina FSU 941]|nr:hypothetical protein K501DRAFT_269229 [Backusella circina FSU 941]
MTNSFLPCTNGRPDRFIKPSSRPTLPSPNLSANIRSVVRSFEYYSKKTYQEGYILRHNSGSLPTHFFAELEGSTLYLWNAGNSNGAVQPQFIQITDNTIIKRERKNGKHLFSLFFKEKKPPCQMLFEAMDNGSLVNWITAFYLSNFERQKLYQLFTVQIITPHATTKKKKASYLQVRRPGMQWKKYWVVISTKKRKLFSMMKNEKAPRILFYETKRSREPEFIIDQLSNAYAVYPESVNLIEKRSMIKLENTQESYWVMTQDIKCLKEYLLAIYDLFQLFGRPNQLLMDNTNVHSLNYGEPKADNDGLYLHVNDVASKVDLDLLCSLTIQNTFNSTLKDIMDGNHSRPNIPHNNTNKIPAIPLTQMSEPPISDSSLEETPFVRYAADSSDESESDECDTADDDDFDSDDEPIGNKLQELKSRNSSSAIPKLEDMPTPIPEKIVPSTFGEFNLSTDFGNLLNVPLEKRKYSLPERAFTSCSTPKERCRSWQDEWRSDDTLDDSFDSMDPRYEITQSTLFDQYVSQKLSAKEQVKYSKATGEPLVHVSSKPKYPTQSGLVNLVPENTRRSTKKIRRSQAERLDRERLILENQLMQQQV